MDKLDPARVTCLGPVENRRIWGYQYFAHAAIVLAQDAVQHNESSKIYHYLPTGLPVVSESPVPNNHLLLGLPRMGHRVRALAPITEDTASAPDSFDARHPNLTVTRLDRAAAAYEALLREAAASHCGAVSSHEQLDAGERLVTGALNTGMRAAKTPYARALHCDDLLDPRSIEVLRACLARYPDVDYFHSVRIRIDKEGKPIRMARTAGLKRLNQDASRVWTPPRSPAG